jgi:hypothetical protein
LEIRNAGRRIDVTEIDSFEIPTSTRLPLDYRNFLLTFNGGSPDSNIIHVEHVDYMPTVLQVFFGIGRTVESSNLDWNFANTFDQSVVPTMLPVATDTFGNLFCFQVEDGTARKIFYCSFEDEGFEFHFVCNTFTELLGKLY